MKFQTQLPKHVRWFDRMLCISYGLKFIKKIGKLVNIKSPAPGQPSGIRSLCAAVVWGPPDQPNGVIVGYDIEFKNASQVILTAKEANELFHVAEGSSIPTGQGDLEFRVRLS